MPFFDSKLMGLSRKIVLLFVGLSVVSCSNADRLDSAFALSDRGEIFSSSELSAQSLSAFSSALFSSMITFSSGTSSSVPFSSSSASVDYSVYWRATNAVGFLQGQGLNGSWYTFTDSVDGGNSTIAPANPFRTADSASYDWIGEYITDSCDGASLCAVMTLGSDLDYPYAGVGVNFLDPRAEVDVSNKYLCFSYTATQAWRLNLRFSSSNESTMDLNTPGWEMKKATACTTVSKAFSSATQQSGWGTSVTVGDYLKLVEGLAFYYNGTLADAGSVNSLNIYDFIITDYDCSPL